MKEERANVRLRKNYLTMIVSQELTTPNTKSIQILYIVSRMK